MHGQTDEYRRRGAGLVLSIAVLATAFGLIFAPHSGTGRAKPLPAPPKADQTIANSKQPAPVAATRGTSEQLTSVARDKGEMERLAQLQLEGAIPPIDTETPPAVEQQAPTLLLNAPILPQNAVIDEAAKPAPN